MTTGGSKARPPSFWLGSARAKGLGTGSGHGVGYRPVGKGSVSQEIPDPREPLPPLVRVTLLPLFLDLWVLNLNGDQSHLGSWFPGCTLSSTDLVEWGPLSWVVSWISPIHSSRSTLCLSLLCWVRLANMNCLRVNSYCVGLVLWCSR